MYGMIVWQMRVQLILAVVVLVIPVVLFAGTEEISPMQKEILELFEAEKSELAILNTQFKNATNSEEALSLQLQIQERKIATNVSWFSIQMKYAQQQGDENRVKEIEAIIRTLGTTGSKGEPVSR